MLCSDRHYWLFFFFKQKTAYEMRISDWSSDVCSSDRCASGSRSRRDFPRGHPAPAENAAHPCAAPFGSCPPVPPLRRGPECQSQSQGKDKGKEIGRASCRERVCQYV